MARIVGAIWICILLISSCKDDLSFTTSEDELTIKADTVFFDTVFTSPGSGIPMSVNKQFVVVNPFNEAIKTDIRIGGGESSPFRINVDGISGLSLDGIEILPEDSVFVFVELTIDPNNDPKSLPLIVRDSIQFFTNGNEQNVQLIAWGQDAHYLFRDTLCNMVLSDKLKPYVVYGYLYVPENCQLTIEEGVQFHFAPNSWLFVEGTLNINGTKENPVKFEGDRLEPDYEELAGQWGGIWFSYPSKRNSIKHTRIKNGTVGIYCDSSSSDGLYTITASNTEVRNMSFDGFSGKGSSMKAENSVFANCGRYSFLGLYGGNYELKHCSFLTYNFDFSRRDPTFVLNNIERDQLGRTVATFDIGAQVQNSIIYGSLDNEIALDLDQSKVRALQVQNNLIRTELMDLDKAGLDNIVNQDPLIINYRNQEFGIDTLSPAKDIGKTLDPPVLIDFDEVTRDSKPDAGAFELNY